MIDVLNVTHHYGVRPVIQDVSLHVEPGEVLALMGPNGMGKTTLLAIIAGALSPIEGSVRIDGKVRRSTPEDELAIRKQVVYLPADAWLPLSRTGREWLLAVGRLYGVDERRLMEHVPRLLALFDLETQADQPIPDYSTGQRKKLALCGALITDAPILLLDEPFSGGLDPSGIMALKRVLQFHRERRDRTVVMATPVPELVEELADRIAIIHDGRIIAHDTIPALQRASGVAGSLDQIYEKLVNPQAAAKIQKYFGEAT